MKCLLLSLVFWIGSFAPAFAQPCDPWTPSYIVDLTGTPDSIWQSPPEIRDGHCCSASGSERCIEFVVTLDPGALGIQFNIVAGAIPPGALFYEIGCANPTQVGDTLCLDGVGPHRITFCKPGNNTNVYEIVSVQAPNISPATTVSDGCSGLIYVTGYDESTVNWSPTPFNADYLNYMSCTTGCDTVQISVTQSGYPPFIDFEVSGYPPFNLCDTSMLRDTVRVYFVSDKFVEILPENPVVCFGGTNTTVTANPSGGAPPYTYLWNTGETTQSISVGVGTYWVEVFDTTNCPTVFDTVIVTAQLSPISADAGLDAASCTNLPTATISGTVNVAGGGIWSGGAGSYSPSDTALTANYTPTPAEINAGSVTLTLTTTDNDGCPPESDNMTIIIEPAPIIDAGSNQVVCGDINSIPLAGTFTNAGGVVWTTSGTGTFGNLNNPITNYIPSTLDTASGTITLTLTTTLTGACAPVSDIVNITFTPIPVVNANIDQSVCSDVASVSLGGSVTVATGGTWTTNGTGTFSPDANTLTANYIPSALDAISGDITLTLTSTGNGNCNTYSDQMIITFYNAPTVNVGPDQTVCADIGTVILSPTTTDAVTYLWTTTGSGLFTPNNTTEIADYIPSNADTANGNITLTLTVIADGCSNYEDDLNITITPSPTVNAGNDITTCKDISLVNLSGAVTVGTGGTWSTSGTGSFSPSANSLGGNYIPSSADTAAGSVTLTLTTTGNGTCNSYTDDVLITFTEIPTVNAGLDQSICADIGNVPLTGAITIATGGIWTTSGTGTFTPGNTSLGGVYHPSNADTTAGSVTLTLTTTGNGLCNAYNDQMIITISPAPIVSAGSDQIVCGDISSVGINGSVINASGGFWSTSGTGTFAPNNTLLNANYIPSAADTLAGSVSLTLTSTGNGTCNTYTDQMTISFTPAPTVDAGIDITTCKDIASIDLSGAIVTATGGTWSTSGTGTFNPNNTTLTAAYIPSAADTAAGSITLTLTTTGNGLCNAYSDQMTITLTDIPTVDAGADQIICADAASAFLGGSVNNATGGIWSTSGTGTFNPNNTTLTAAYIPSEADTVAGSVTLTLTTTGNGLCNAYSDQMTITITPAPIANAGPDQTLCADITTIPLSGEITTATGGVWSTSGTGTFAPNANTLNASYIPTTADTIAGSVILTLTTAGNGTCNTYTDQMTISFTPAPTVDAGIDITTCKDIASIDLSGAIVTATGGTWSTSGTGTFNPNNTTLTAAYIPSAADTAAGSITLTLTTTGNGLCNTYSDQMTITLTDIPTVDAGADQIICADAASAFLGGSVNNATGGIWSTSGTGTFNPNNTTLTAAYIPSEADTVAGSVTLTLTTTGNGLCNAYSDQMTITITPAPIANAGPDQTLCADITAIPLSGEITTATGGVWSTSGTGTFAPNANTLNASYIPTTADTIAGSVILTLTTAGNGTCNTYTDQMTISFTPAPTVDAGIDITTCKDIASIDLSGAIVTATGGTWSTSGTGTFNPNNTTLTAAYIPSAADTAAGSITLTLTTTGNGLCNAYSDQMTITLTDIPVAYASSDQIVCADISGISLNGGIAIAAGGIWTTNGTGIFSPSETALNATYIPSAGDTAIGSATLTLTTTGNGLCQSYTDQMMITITPAPIAFAGNDTSVCSTNPVVPLIGSVVTATGGIWSTNGSGTFTPNNTDLNAIYQTSLSDQTNGLVEIYLTTTGNGLCNSVTDTMLLTITPTSITVFVGNDSLVCGDDSLILNATIQTATGGIWTTLGDGIFSDSSDLSAIYYFGANDTIANTVNLYFTTTGNGGCLAQVDSLQVGIQNPLELSVMANDTVCRNGGAFNIFSTTNTGQGYWLTNGDGSFLPDSNSLNPQYLLGNTDTAANNITLTFITENNGVCTAIYDSLVIDLIDAPAVNFGFADICLNETVFFTDSSSSIGGVTDWSWNFNDTILSSQQDTNVTFTSFGIQTATLVVASSYGCIDSLTQNIIVSPLPTAALTSNADCYEDSVEMFDASTVATGAIVGWEWMVENEFTGNTQNVSVIFDSASVYSTTLIVTTDVGCTDTITDSLQVQPNPIASFISDSVCLNELSNMVDASTVEFGSIVTWEWIIDGLSADTLSATTYTFESDSLQPVTLVVTSSFGCMDTVTQDILIHPLPNSAFSYEGFCEEDNVLFTDESTINTGQVIAWNWDFGNTESSVEQNPSNGFGVAGTFDVTLITTSNYGCVDTIAQNISISPNPTAEFSMSSNITQVLDPIYFTDESIDASQWEWDFGDTIGTSTDQNPDYSWNNYNQYTVSLIITNDFGCTDTVTHSITVKQPPKLPLAFSPNGDGLNDIFYVIGGTFVEFRFEIYNNWGKMIFESNDPLIGWDGTHLDIEQPLGVYVWIYHVVTEDGEEYSEHGDVTIIR